MVRSKCYKASYLQYFHHNIPLSIRFKYLLQQHPVFKHPKSEVLTTVKISVFVFWIVTSHGLESTYQRFRETLLLFTLNMEAVFSPKSWYLLTDTHGFTIQNENVDTGKTVPENSVAFIISHE
jgi:hypothetical protein